MTKEEYLDHLGDLVDSKKEGCYGVESIITLLKIRILR